MLFPTFEFALFFLIVFPITWMLNNRADYRKLFLISASYFFYAFWDYRFVLLILLSSLINHHAGWLLTLEKKEKQRKLILTAAIIANLLILGYFKYYGFFIESLGLVLKNIGLERDLPLIEIILPIGISFFTFQGISYVADIYTGKLKKNASLVDLLLYISFFPQLVAGPIVRASYFLPQLRKKPFLTRTMMSLGIVYILIGLVKKMIVANYLATHIVDQVFANPSDFGTVDLTVAIYAYAVQIYCDFSGYSDIAIGVAALLGYRFQRNFKQPYRASSIRDFWHRWHMSLSQWLRDYLFIPLGGSRFGKFLNYRNLFITMLLGGIWHGAAWTFIIWGVLHGTYLIAEKLLSKVKLLEKIFSPVSVLITFHLVCFAWIFFRAENLSLATEYIASFKQFYIAPVLSTPFIIFLVLAALLTHFIRADFKLSIIRNVRYYSIQRFSAVMGSAIVFIWSMAPDGVAPFIYFAF